MKRIFVFQETAEDYEDYKKWFRPDLEHCYFAMYSRHRSAYRKGDQLFNSYGARDNRFLLTNYGFTLRRNKYNSLGFKVFLNYSSDGGAEDRFQKIIKIKLNKLSDSLLQYLRASLIFSYRDKHGNASNNYLKHLLVSVPVDPSFEIHILETGLNLTSMLLN